MINPPSTLAGSPWSPFHHRTYAVIWTATVVANIGGWMYSAAAAWLMTTLDPHPFTVALVQVATTLPLFLFALPAGALADIVDKRRFLIGIQLVLVVLSTIFATLVMLELVTPTLLLVFMFLIATCSALDAPAMQSIVPQLVPREELSKAVAANSVGINISRAVGPALSGVATASFGVAAPFWLDVFSNAGTIAALIWWKRAPRKASRLPAERLIGAMRIGVRYARNNPPLRATLARTLAFFVFASAYWALLPLLAKTQLSAGPAVYGVLLGAIGLGAIGTAFLLPRIRAKLSPDAVVAVGTGGTAVALILYAVARDVPTALVASLLAGGCWIGSVSTINLSAQLALPDWVRGRGLAIYVTMFNGAVALGSVLWGEVAAHAGLPMAHLAAAAGAVAFIPLTWRCKLQSGARLDLTPSMNWPEPVVAEDLAPQAGPVLVVVEYRVRTQHRQSFLSALDRVAPERRRDGAYAWQVFEDTSESDRFIETFLLDSWIEHLRQHARVTHADRALQERVNQCLVAEAKVTHFVAPQAR